jgi:hypothetical protein
VPLAENLKTLWFQDGIKDTSLDAVKASINANRANFSDFDSIKDAYVEFMHTQNPTHDPKTRLPLLPAEDAEVAVVHTKTRDKDHRPATNARRGLFPRLR